MKRRIPFVNNLDPLILLLLVPQFRLSIPGIAFQTQLIESTFLGCYADRCEAKHVL